MTEEKEVELKANGEGKEDSNVEETVAEEANAEGSNEDKNDDKADEASLEESIIRQMEYYFSDINLPRDKFLNEQTKLDDGWVPLEVLTRFNRLSKLTTDVDVIVKALQKSTSGLLEISDTKVRRSPKMPIPEMTEDRRKQLLARTVYAKGFAKDSTLDDLLQFFKPFEVIENLIMRRYLDKRTKKRMFKGSIFITFKTRDQADKFVETKNLKFKGTDLLVLWQEDYLKMKQEEHANRRDKREKRTKEVVVEVPEKADFSLPTGTVLYFSDGHDTISREDIKSAILAHDKDADIGFVDFKVGLTHGWIRFGQENGAKEYMKLISDGTLSVGDHKVNIRLLEGDEEKEYLDKTAEEMGKRRRNMKNYKHKGKGNFKGKYGKKRRQQDHEDAPPAKEVKTDS
ncbi:la protein homolog [Epargyreus clarus]|uniref:la protein homolog n=1 Tax=Epargyreus clarus TaxID=520877 RepID=UPI003C2FA2A0